MSYSFSDAVRNNNRPTEDDGPRAYEAITRLAMRLFDVPVALISIVEEENDRQFFISQQGLPEPWASRRETPLSHSFCQHVKRSGAPLVVGDARETPQVRDNLAIRDLDVIAYLGVPLHTPQGQPTGALCVIQPTPRAWKVEDVRALGDLAACVHDEFRLREVMRQKNDINAALQASQQRNARYNAMREQITHAFMAPDLPINQRFALLLDSSCHALGAEHGALAKWDGSRFRVLFTGTEGKPSPGPDPELPESRDLLAADIVADPRLRHFSHRPRAEASGRHDLGGRVPSCYLAAPLLMHGQFFGVLEFSSSKPRAHRWSEEELSLVSLTSMFACAHLHVQGQIADLKHAETTLLNYLVETKHGPRVFNG